jgi:hypothetical protein
MMASVMTVYSNGVPIGHTQDYGRGRCLAHVRQWDGKFVSLGFQADRTTAREAIETAHRTGNIPKPPPEAA